MNDLRPLIRAVMDESRTYFSADTLPSGRALRQALEAARRGTWQRLQPIERFFVFNAQPSLADDAGPVIVAESYCAALRSLPADWWGLPGAVDTSAAQNLVALGRSAIPCLSSITKEERPLRYLNGEANAIAASLSHTLADLAAGLLAAILKQPFDWRAGPAERAVGRERLRKL